MTTLEVQKRDATKKARSTLRKQEMVPAVVYGKKEKSTPIAVSLKEFTLAWKEAGESTVLTLKGLEGDKDVLIQEVSVDPIYGEPVHIDFYAIEADKLVVVSVPLVFEGVAPAEKELGGNLTKVMHDIEVEALPKNLPHDIVVDISGLKTFEDQIHASQIVLPAGVSLACEPEEVVALVAEAVEESEEEPTEAPDMSAIEVEKKGKDEDSSEGGDGEEKSE